MSVERPRQDHPDAALERGPSRRLQYLSGGEDRRLRRHDPLLPACRRVSSSLAINRSSKGNFSRADDLVILVTFPGDQDDVIAIGQADCRGNGLLPVGDDEITPSVRMS